jgi:hypothetical protein
VPRACAHSGCPALGAQHVRECCHTFGDCWRRSFGSGPSVAGRAPGVRCVSADARRTSLSGPAPEPGTIPSPDTRSPGQPRTDTSGSLRHLREDADGFFRISRSIRSCSFSRRSRASSAALTGGAVGVSSAPAVSGDNSRAQRRSVSKSMPKSRAT